MYDLILSGIRSSYAENHLGDFFYTTALAHKPELAVELGSFMGYSSLHIAAALRDNKDTRSELHLIDLWDKYTYRHCSLETIVQNFKKMNFCHYRIASVASSMRMPLRFILTIQQVPLTCCISTSQMTAGRCNFV